MLSRWIRAWDSIFLRPFILLIAGLGVTPNALTICSLAFSIMAGVMLFANQLQLGGLSLLVGGLLDGLDGELARSTGHQTNLGAFLDSICDHLGDFAVALGIATLYLSRGSSGEVLLVLAALFGSLFGSQVRSRAGMLGLDLKNVGIATRFERNLVLILGSFLNAMPVALWILALLNNLTALQRTVHATRAMIAQQKSQAGPRRGVTR